MCCTCTEIPRRKQWGFAKSLFACSLGVGKMTPEQRAAVKRRATMACKEMRRYGFDLAKTKEALKRLLKMLDYDWDAIEANDYSLLVDSLIAFASSPHTDNSAGEVDFEQAEPMPSTSLCDEIAPLEKPHATVLTGEASSPKKTDQTVPVHDSFEERYWPSTATNSVGTKRKGGVAAPLPGSFCLKKPKLEPDVEHAAVNTSSDHAIDNFGDTLPNSGPSTLEAAENRLIPFYEHEDQMNPAGKDSQDNNTTETPIIVKRNISQQSALRINKMNVVEKNSEDNHEQEPLADPNIVGINGKDSDNHSKDHPVCSITTIEIASSSNGKVKMCLSVNHESTNFHMPDIDTILKIAEKKCLETYKMQQADFSIMDLMKKVCETFVELDKSDT